MIYLLGSAKRPSGLGHSNLTSAKLRSSLSASGSMGCLFCWLLDLAGCGGTANWMGFLGGCCAGRVGLFGVGATWLVGPGETTDLTGWALLAAAVRRPFDDWDLRFCCCSLGATARIWTNMINNSWSKSSLSCISFGFEQLYLPIMTSIMHEIGRQILR